MKEQTKIGYIRVDRSGPSPIEQIKALEAHGIRDFTDTSSECWVDGLRTRKPKPNEDPLPQRTNMLKALRDGDVVVVANAGRLGVSREDILRTLGEIGQQGAAVMDAAEGRIFTCPPGLADAASFAEKAHRVQMLERAARARRGRAEFGAKSGPKPKLRKDEIEAIRLMWNNPAVTKEQVETESGLKTRTLYRLLGPRGTPAFGRVVESKRKKRR